MTTPRILSPRSSEASRLASLKGLAHTIAWRLLDVEARLIKRGEPVTPELLARHFMQMAQRSDGMKEGPATTREIALLASEMVPAAIESLNRKVAA
jgi:hypothetical protein